MTIIDMITLAWVVKTRLAVLAASSQPFPFPRKNGPGLGCIAVLGPLFVFLPEALMSAKLYVGNFSYATTDANLTEMFSPYGTVRSALVINDRETGRSKGFGFVEMQNDGEAQAAIAGLNGNAVDGRSLTVNEAKPKEARTGGRPMSGGYGRSY